MVNRRVGVVMPVARVGGGAVGGRGIMGGGVMNGGVMGGAIATVRLAKGPVQPMLVIARHTRSADERQHGAEPQGQAGTEPSP